MTKLAGRRCIITGASRGLGATVARTFWAQGADLLLVARSEAKLKQVIGELGVRPDQRVHAMTCDLGDEETPNRIIEQAHRLLGGVSVLVNNAALQGPIGPVWENDWAEWECAFRVNLLSVVNLCRSCVPLIATSGGGKIISISGGGAGRPRPRFTAYGAAKAAMVKFCETLADEVRPLGIDVNCVAPGPMNSAMTDAILAAGAERTGRKEYDDALGVRHQGTDVTERAAALCAFLASSESDGITGKLISALWDPWETFGKHLDELRKTDIYTLRRILPKERGFDWGAR